MANIAEFQDDMSEDEKTSLQDYVTNGCPGLIKAGSSDVFRWFELYITGKSYSEIAKITNSRLDLILYISNKQKWNDKKMKHYSDLLTNMSNRLSQVKLASADTVTTAIMALGKYFSREFDRYLANNDRSIIDGLDTKLLAQYYKSMDTLDKIMNPVKKKISESSETTTNPLVNINMGSGTIKKVGKNEIEITEKSGNILKAMAKAKKQQIEEEES